MDNSIFDPESATIGGMALISIQLVIMAQLRSYFPGHIRKWTVTTRAFDLLNYPLAAILVLLVVPPWPPYSYESWRNYIGASLATGALASITAKKIQTEKGADNEETEPPPRVDVKPLIPRKDS